MTKLSIGAFTFLAATLQMCAAEGDPAWTILDSVAHDRRYSVLFRDLHCVEGLISTVGSDTITLMLIEKQEHVQIQRSEILRVSENPDVAANDTVYSGRSSWDDVKKIHPVLSEYLQIVTKHGETLKWKKATVTDTSIANKNRVIAKKDIQEISFTRFTPTTEFERYVIYESVPFLARRTWFNYAFFPKISVLIYRSNAPEDNTPAKCRRLPDSNDRVEQTMPTKSN